MATLNLAALKHYLVPTEVGSIDYEASAKKLLTDLETFEKIHAANGARIVSAVASVFDKFKGANLNKDALRTFTMTELDAQPENYSVLVEALNDYLKDNTGEQGKSLFGMKKGIGGGFWRWSDKPAPAAK